MPHDPLLDFSDQVALVTGAASGLGAELAKALGARGAHLVLGDINAEALAALADELGQSGIQVVARPTDVSREEDCARLVACAQETFGRLDMAVNNAGVAAPLQFLDQTSEEEMDRQYRINQKGVMFGLKYQLPLMRQQGAGAILNVSSLAGIGGAPKIAAYSAAKHAVVGLTKTAAIENAGKGVRVNAICPFFTLTPMVTDIDTPDGVTPEMFQSALAERCPMRRLALPEEVVAAMLLLLSPKMTYVTGQALAVDGGVTAF